MVETKKTLLALVLAATVGTIGLQQADARSLDHDGGIDSTQFHKMNDATKAKMEKFQAETKDLRKQIKMKRAEKTALIQSVAPNIEAVKETAGELFDLQMTMREKALAAGLFTFMKDGDKEGKITAKPAKLEKFLADTKDLRKQIYVKRAEKQALMHNRVPDAVAIAKVTGELFDLRSAIQEKAKEAGLPRHWQGKGKGRHHQE